MSGLQDACPFEPQVRAARCESCCHATAGLTPCVVAWLSPARPVQMKARSHAAEIIPVLSEQRRAA